MTAVKSHLTDARDFNKRKTMKSLKVLKEIETDQESNSSSSEDVEYYSPKSVVMNPNARNVNINANVSRVRINNPVLRIRTEDKQIGEDIGEGFVTKFIHSGADRMDGMMFSRPVSPLGGKTTSFGSE